MMIKIKKTNFLTLKMKYTIAIAALLATASAVRVTKGGERPSADKIFAECDADSSGDLTMGEAKTCIMNHAGDKVTGAQVDSFLTCAWPNAD